MGEKVFQLHIATPAYATPVSLYKTKQETSSTGTSFPACAQQGLFPLLVHKIFFPCWCAPRVFFPCWCTTRSFFPAGAHQGLLSLLGWFIIYKVPTLKFCHCNKTKWPLVRKHTNWVDNHQMIITSKYGSHYFMCYGENAIWPFSHYVYGTFQLS